VAILFLVLDHRESQIAYTMMMSTKYKFKPFIIKGKNVSKELNKYGIDKVPTLYFPEKMAKVEGSSNIARYMGIDLTLQKEPKSQNKKKKSKKPLLEPKYQKALKDEYYSDDEFEQRFKEAHSEGSIEDKRAEEEESYYDSESDSRDSLQRSLDDNPIRSEEEEIGESEYEGDSDEISLEV